MITVGSVICCYISNSNLFHFLFEHDQLFGLCADDNFAVKTVLGHPFYLRINRCCANTAANEEDIHLLELLGIHLYQVGRSSERAGNIHEAVACFELGHTLCRSADGLEYDRYGACLAVIIADGKRDSLALLINLYDQELTGLTGSYYPGCLYNHQEVLL